MHDISIKVPALPESVADAKVLVWHKKEGDFVKADEVILELETDKVVLEVPSPTFGVLSKVLVQEGSTVQSDQELAYLRKEMQEAKKESKEIEEDTTNNRNLYLENYNSDSCNDSNFLSPHKRHKSKILSYLERQESQKDDKDCCTNSDNVKNANNSIEDKNINSTNTVDIKMNSIRKAIKKSMIQARNKMVMLTTFNEVNMEHVLLLKDKYKSKVLEKYNARLSITPFCIKAAATALKKHPKIYANYQDEQNIYCPNDIDINIAVSTDRGLVCPILEKVNNMSVLEISLLLDDMANKARNYKLCMQDLKLGCFTITNGGIFGSLLSTPIVNSSQVAILGLHAIKDRPVAVNKEVVVLPIMNIALSYDHCFIDGKDAISFLNEVKKHLEDPVGSMLLGI